MTGIGSIPYLVRYINRDRTCAAVVEQRQARSDLRVERNCLRLKVSYTW